MNSQIMVNNVSNSDSALLWGGCGNGFTAQPVLPNTTDSRVCGVQSQNLSVLQPCCNGAELQQYQCWTYCKYPGDILDFSRCLGNDTQVFCQSGQRSNLTESLKTSFGFKSYSAPRMSWVVLALLFAILFVNPSSATIIPSLDNSGIVRRQSTSCTFSKDQVYGYSGRQIRVSSDIGCSARMCPQPYSVDTGIDNNNRTINGTSAADPKYDQIFEIVGNATGRLFPAQSSVNITQEVIVLGGQSGYLSWVPQHFCTNGTVTNCKGVLGDSNDAIYQEFCGPIFAGDAMGNGTGNTIQGSFIFVTTE